MKSNRYEVVLQRGKLKNRKARNGIRDYNLKSINLTLDVIFDNTLQKFYFLDLKIDLKL